MASKQQASGRAPVVISLGGSMLFADGGLDAAYVGKAAALFEKLKAGGVPLAVVVGGGRTARDYTRVVRELTESEFWADRVAIYGTRLNALLLISVLGDAAYPKVVTDFDEAFYALRNDLIAVGAGMIEGITTDTDAVLLAERLGAARLVNVSTADGIYSADPEKDKSARKLARVTHAQLVELAMRGDDRRARTNFVFDLVASKLAQRSNVELHFVSGRDLGGVEKAIRGQAHGGTVVRK